MATVAENLLYECIRELSYVQSVEADIDSETRSMFASSNGAELIERGMMALQIQQLAEDTLDLQKLAEWEKICGGNKAMAKKLSDATGSYEVPILERKYKCSKCGYPLGNDDGLCVDCAAEASQ